MKKHNDVLGKVVVIAGGGGVICGHFAKFLARQGAKIDVLDLNLGNAQNVVNHITASGGVAKAYAANVLIKGELEKVRTAENENLGTCDILINGAGGNHPAGTTSSPFFSQEDLDNKDLRSFFDLDVDGVDFVFKLNFLGTLIPTQVFAIDMLEKDNASIINISSMNSFTPLTKIPAYSGAKSAISNFTQWLAVHFSKQNIRVNAMAPGFFLTEQNYNLLMQEDGNLTPRGQQIIDHTPAGRFGDPEDLEGTLLWLCSKGSLFVTGGVVPIDGGFNAYSGV